MNQPPLRYFLQTLGWQSQPFRLKPEQDRRNRFSFGPRFLRNEELTGFAPVLGREHAVEEFDSPGRIRRAVTTMNEFLQLGTSAISINTDFTPATRKLDLPLALRQRERLPAARTVGNGQIGTGHTSITSSGEEHRRTSPSQLARRATAVPRATGLSGRRHPSAPVPSTALLRF